MQEIITFLKEEYEKVLFKKQNILDNKQILVNELEDIKTQEQNISIREDNPDYVFLADCFERTMDEKTLSSIEQRRVELTNKKLELETEAEKVDGEVNRIRDLYNKSIICSQNMGLPDTYREKLEFILQLMESDIQRAKLELSCFLKEEM